jgi:hypothetical protein
MSRTASKLVGGYYPFPPEYISSVASLFKTAPSGGLLLDPCAGEGTALEALATALNLKPYANELDHDRATACRESFGISQAVEGDLFQLRTPHHAFQLLWVNPPYTENLGHALEKRREFEMLKEAWKWCQEGGFVAWVVYNQHMTERAAHFLLTNSDLVDIYRVPGLHLDTYVQIVVIARKREKIKSANIDEQALSLAATCQNPASLPELRVVDEALYKLPTPASIRRFYFHPDKVTPEIMLPALQQLGAHLMHSFQSISETPPPPPDLTPVVPPRGGQLGLILAAGLFNGLVLKLDSGPAAVRGVVRMVEVETTQPEMKGVRETFEHRAQVTITLLHRTGKITVIEGKDSAQLVSFINKHQGAFLEYLDQHSRPVYDFDYSHLNDVFARVFRNRKLPGRPMTGLFETQRHVTAAAYATLMQRKSVVLVSDMGTGKSVMGAALIGALHAKGHFKQGQIGVIMAPPHLVKKWEAEFRDAVPGSLPRIVETVEGVTAFMAEVDQQPHKLHVLILSRERAKLGEGWAPAFVLKKEHIAQWPYNTSPPIRFLDPETKELRTGVQRVVKQMTPVCPCCGVPISKTQDGKGAPVTVSWLKQQPRKCHACAAPLWQLKRTFSAPKEGEKFARKNPRYPLASLLRERYSRRLAVVAVDEFHETKGGSSDQGRAMQDLVLVADRAIGLTGTIFGGTASSIFWLEWAMNSRMYQHYPISRDEGGRATALRRWVRTMGVLERVVEFKQENADSGRYSGVVRIDHAPQEVPGISPLLVRELIDHAIWCGLPDMAFSLPPYVEIPIAVDLPGEIQSHYDREKKRMIDYLLDCKKSGDGSFLGVYLQAALRYPSSCFRTKPVVHKTPYLDATGQRIERVVTTLKSFGEDRLYPKEEELIRILREELADDRPCVVFVAQSGTLDIQPRLEALIKRDVPGAKPIILRSNTVPTDERDGWLKKQVVAGHNILICNPKLVSTGLDLLDFKSLIFYEQVYSLYDTAQASRRHWRIGQTAECRCYYLFYQNTLEAQAIELISQKQAAAALLGGDADGGGLAQLSGGASSLEAELAKSIASSEIVVDVTKLFQQKAHASADFTSGWAQGKARTGEGGIEVIPLENVIGQRYQHSGTMWEVVDYGPLTEATYRVRKVADDTEHIFESPKVLALLAGQPVSSKAPVAAPPKASPVHKPEAEPVRKPAMPVHRLPARLEEIRQVYLQAKQQHPQALVFVETSGAYITFGSDATAATRIIESPVTRQVMEGQWLPRTQVPRREASITFKRLMAGNQTVALANGHVKVLHPQQKGGLDAKPDVSEQPAQQLAFFS